MSNEDKDVNTGASLRMLNSETPKYGEAELGWDGGRPLVRERSHEPTEGRRVPYCPLAKPLSYGERGYKGKGYLCIVLWLVEMR